MRHGKLALCGFVAALALAGTARADDKADRQTQQRELEQKKMLDQLRQEREQRRKADPNWQEAEKLLKELEEQQKRYKEQERELAEKVKGFEAEAQKQREKADLLLRQLEEQRQSSRDSEGRSLLLPLHYYDKRPAPELVANLRGEVTEVAENMVVIDVGINAGLGVGNTFDVYRLEGGGRLLGTAKVTSALNLFPKQAILTFTPARDVPFE